MYELEDCNLEGKYKDWQKKLHPDLVHSKSEVWSDNLVIWKNKTLSDAVHVECLIFSCQEEKEYAAEQSARVIDAYRTLRKPLARAIYIVSMVSTKPFYTCFLYLKLLI